MEVLIMKDYTICVWDCTFTIADENGEDLKHEDGTIKIFDAPDLDWSHIAEYVDEEDLVLSKEERFPHKMSFEEWMNNCPDHVSVNHDYTDDEDEVSIKVYGFSVDKKIERKRCNG
tara:strand:- start:371 stop:718 length:348 start_codon:yes stop_codon:yes gene_type:complete